MLEDTRTRLRRKLVEVFGVDEADLLMDRPPGGWGDLVTNQTLDLRIAASEARTEGRIAALDARMEGRFTDLENRMNSAFTDLDHRMTAGFDIIEARFTDSDHRMTAGFEIVDHKLTAQRADILSEIERGFRNQTWKLVGVMTALMAIVVAALRV